MSLDKKTMLINKIASQLEYLVEKNTTSDYIPETGQTQYHIDYQKISEEMVRKFNIQSKKPTF